jgi:hypothetical protein
MQASAFLKASQASRAVNSFGRVDRAPLHHSHRTGTGCQTAEQVGHHDLEFLLTRHLDVFDRRPAKVVDEVAGLSFVPPADEFDTHAEALQGLFGLIDLNLETTVREEKWVRMIEQNFHASVSALELQDELFVTTVFERI